MPKKVAIAVAERVVAEVELPLLLEQLQEVMPNQLRNELLSWNEA